MTNKTIDPATDATDRPDIVVLIADDLRATNATPDLMPFSFDFFETQFERCYAPSTWTLPSHASLYSGVDPTKHGVTQTGDKLSSEQATLPDCAREAGYATALFSENPFFSGYRGFGNGVDFVNDHINYKLAPADFSIANWADSMPRAMRAFLSRLIAGESRAADLVNSVYTAGKYLQDGSASNSGSPHNTERVLSHVRQYLHGRKGDGPSMSFVNLLETHNPHTVMPQSARALGIEFDEAEVDALNSPDDDHEFLFGNDDVRDPFGDWDNLYRKKLDAYRTSVHHLDGLLEEFVANLDGEYLSNSLVILTGDHGEMFGEEGMVSHQTSLHPAGIQVPLFVKFPDDWRNNKTTSSSPVNWMGLSETLKRVTTGQISTPKSFQKTLVEASKNSETGSLICAVGGPNWDVGALEEEYGEQTVREKIGMRRVGLIHESEMTVYLSRWGSEEVTERRYRLSDSDRTLIEEQQKSPSVTRLDRWLRDKDETVSHNVSERLKDLGYA